LELANIDPTIQSLNEKCLEIKSDSLDYLFKKINLDAKERKLIDRMMESALKRLIREPIINLKQIDNKHKRDEYIKLIEELFDI
ncbi:glutamyl-tRNA reductase, partial [Turicibacter sanguinis]|nr:glutamyl-tRNA reductase [Turicibacter sanguinis]